MDGEGREGVHPGDPARAPLRALGRVRLGHGQHPDTQGFDHDDPRFRPSLGPEGKNLERQLGMLVFARRGSGRHLDAACAGPHSGRAGGHPPGPYLHKPRGLGAGDGLAAHRLCQPRAGAGAAPRGGAALPRHPRGPGFRGGGRRRDPGDDTTSSHRHPGRHGWVVHEGVTVIPGGVAGAPRLRQPSRGGPTGAHSDLPAARGLVHGGDAVLPGRPGPLGCRRREAAGALP
mmetsp:Transcript_12133/g.37982  ORF Transcript_12133/g.37982 Transcript_12133/m.37982 type:complete len:231 (+) Transcript_12133:2925-3617(+)